jgi:hypothetical protein
MEAKPDLFVSGPGVAAKRGETQQTGVREHSSMPLPWNLQPICSWPVTAQPFLNQKGLS